MTDQEQEAPAPEPHRSIFDPVPPGERPPVPPATPPVIEPVAEPEPSARMPEPRTARRGGTPFAVTLLFTAALAGAGYWGWSHPKPGVAVDTHAIDTAKAELSQQIQALSARLDTLEKQATSGDATADLAKKLDDLSGRVTALSGKQDDLAAQAAKDAELLAQKSAAPPQPAAAPPDNTAQQVPNLEAQQRAADAGHSVDPAQADLVAQQKAALDALDQRLAKLEQGAGQAQQAGDAAQKAQSTDTAALDALNARVAKLEQGAGQTEGAARDADRAAHITAAETALEAGQPLGDVPGAPPAIARFANTAPPTEGALRAAYPKVAEAARLASEPQTQDRSFLERLLARAQESVVVRRGDQVIVGDPAAGVLARAQEHVSAGDLKGAADVLAALRGPAAVAVHDWVDQVHALVEARAALAAMAAHG
jgi:hypothetical protein